MCIRDRDTKYDRETKQSIPVAWYVTWEVRIHSPKQGYGAKTVSYTHLDVYKRQDDTHAEIDGVNYSMPDFAKRMKHNQISFAPA